MNRPTHLGQRYLVVQVAKYCQHRKVFEIGADPATPKTEDIYTDAVLKSWQPWIHFLSLTAACIIVTVIFEKGKEVSGKIVVFSTSGTIKGLQRIPAVT